MCLLSVAEFSGESYPGSYDPLSPAHPSPTPDSEAPLETGSSKDGFFILRKDSERRSTLVKILTEDQDMVRLSNVFTHMLSCLQTFHS